MEGLFFEISVPIIMAVAIAIILRTLKQPPILAYLVAGVLAGPAGFGLITVPELIGVLSSFGIAFLLFSVGLELNINRLRNLGRGGFLTGAAQIIFTIGLGYILIRSFGISGTAAWYIALALTFSSTIIVVKLLTERQELDSLYGRLSMATLLLQDAVAIIALILFSSTTSAEDSAVIYLGITIGKAVLLAGSVYLTSRYLIPRLITYVAHSSELLFLTAVAWCFTIVSAARLLGFSIEIGALLAGLTLAPLPYNLEISSRLKSVRDFFITLFFIALGTQLKISGLGELQPLFWALTAFVVIGNPLIVIATMGFLGYRRRTGFFTGLTLGMVSEFSFVLMSLGLTLGHVSVEEVALVTTVGAVTITITTFLISHSEALYRFFSKALVIFERQKINEHFFNAPKDICNHVVLFGYHRMGERIAKTLEDFGKPILIVDFNPDTAKRLLSSRHMCLYGDMSDTEILERAAVDKASMVISTVPDVTNNLLLIKDIKSRAAYVPVYVTATSWHDMRDLYKAGADYVIFTHLLSADHFINLLKQDEHNGEQLVRHRAQHLKELERHYKERIEQVV